MSTLPLGKLPPALLENLLGHFDLKDPDVLLPPGIGLDCAVLDLGERLLVLKSEPITFVAENIGWYAVQIACNDIATTGAIPRWMLSTILLPEGLTTPGLVDQIGQQLASACRDYGITLIGGHTEITSGLNRPILNTTLIGETTREKLITPRGARPGDILLLTESLPIEGTAILASEYARQLKNVLSAEELTQAQNYTFSPGIGVYRAARTALQAGEIHAMHDPTEGGLAAALHELSQASQCRLILRSEDVPVSSISQRICEAFHLDPLATIASGALLLAVPPNSEAPIQTALAAVGIPCTAIGSVEAGQPQVMQESPSGRCPLPLPARDEIARLFEELRH